MLSTVISLQLQFWEAFLVTIPIQEITCQFDIKPKNNKHNSQNYCSSCYTRKHDPSFFYQTSIKYWWHQFKFLLNKGSKIQT